MARLKAQPGSLDSKLSPMVSAGMGRVGLAAGIALSVIWLTRTQSTDEFAQTMVALSLIATGSIGGVFGSNRLLLRELAPLDVPSGATASLFSTASRSAATTTAVAVVATPLAIIVIVGESSPLLLFGSAVAVAAGSLLYLVSDGLRAIETNRSRWTSELIFGRYGGPAPVWGWLLTLAIVRPNKPGEVISLLALVSVAIGVPLFVRLRATLSPDPQTSGQRSAASTRDFVGRATPFGVSQLTGLIIGSADLWVGALVLGRDELAFYAAARQLLMVVALPLQAAQLAFVAPLARTAANGTTADLQALVTRAARRAAPPAIAAGLVLVVIPEQLLGLAFPSRYRVAALALVILAAGQMFNALTGLCGQALAMSGEEHLVTRINLAAALALPVTAFVGAQLFGMAGLALGVMLVTFALFTSLWWFARDRLAINTRFRVIKAGPASTGLPTTP